MKNDAIIKSIICLITEYKAMVKQNPDQNGMGSLRYLLGQSIRQYDIPEQNHHLSQAAHDRWKALSSDDITKYHYQDWVICDKLSGPVMFNSYNGSHGKGTPITLTKDSTFVFRELFHEDHVIPVSMILDEMIRMQTVDNSSIERLLNEMHICVLLKEEDRKIGRTRNRSLDFQETIRKAYNSENIYLYP